jgi:hypothetical protein
MPVATKCHVLTPTMIRLSIMDIHAAFLCFNLTNHDSIPAANGWTDKLADKSMNEAQTVLVGTNADGVDKCAVSKAEA